MGGVDLINKDSLKRKAIFLAYFTILYNIIEGLVSLWFGISEGSLALAGFGVDALIEVASAIIVLLKLKGDDSEFKINIEKERKSTRAIGYLFIFLAVITILTSFTEIRVSSHPDTTLPGSIISSLSLMIMFFIWVDKLDVGRKLDSSTIIADASCSLACIKLSIVLLIGSVAYSLFPSLWWIDSIAALILSLFIALEGKELIQNSLKSEFTGGCGCS